MLNESAVYESKQICHQKTQPCFSCHLPCSLLQQAQRSCLDFRTPLGFTSLLSPPSRNPSTSSHQVYLSNSTIVPAVRNFDVSKNLFPRHWLHGFKILGAPPHQTISCRRIIPSGPPISGVAIRLALTNGKWVEVMWAEALRPLVCFHYLFPLPQGQMEASLAALVLKWKYGMEQQLAGGRQARGWEIVLCSGNPRW